MLVKLGSRNICSKKKNKSNYISANPPNVIDSFSTKLFREITICMVFRHFNLKWNIPIDADVKTALPTHSVYKFGC